MGDLIDCDELTGTCDYRAAVILSMALLVMYILLPLVVHCCCHEILCPWIDVGNSRSAFNDHSPTRV